VQGVQSDDGSGSDDDAQDLNPDEEAEAQVELFLKKFLIGSESTFLDNIDLLIMLKALPTPITTYNYKNAELFNFNIL